MQVDKFLEFLGICNIKNCIWMRLSGKIVLTIMSPLRGFWNNLFIRFYHNVASTRLLFEFDRGILPYYRLQEAGIKFHLSTVGAVVW